MCDSFIGFRSAIVTNLVHLRILVKVLLISKCDINGGKTSLSKEILRNSKDFVTHKGS